MSMKRGTKVNRLVSVFLLGVLLLAGLMVLLGSHGARGTWTNQPSGNIVWTGTGSDTLVQNVGGNLYVNGSLTLQNSALTFLTSNTHRFKVFIAAGSELRLRSSTITVQGNAISPYIMFAIEDSGGVLEARDNSLLKFPGWINVTGANPRVWINSSTVTGFSDAEVQAMSSTLNVDDNNDGPAITISAGEAEIQASSIPKLYQYPGTITDRRNLVVNGGAKLWVFDSYISINFKNSTGDHNALVADGTAQAFIYNVTVDSRGDPANKAPALVPRASGKIYVFRWLDATVQDNNGIPQQGARIKSLQLPAATAVATYPDNGNAATPYPRVLSYLSKLQARVVTAANFNTTGTQGLTWIPLLSDTLDTTSSSPLFSGSYEENTTVVRGAQTYYANPDISFSPYPALNYTANTIRLTVTLTALRQLPITWSGNLVRQGVTVTENQDVIVTGKITLINSVVTFSQGANYLQIQGSGALTLINTTIKGDHGVYVQVQGGWLNATSGSVLNLTKGNQAGVLSSSGSGRINLQDTTLVGDLQANGGPMTLERVVFNSWNIFVSVSGKTNLWTPTFRHYANISLLTDVGNLNTVVFDIRNVTFSPAMASQLVFSGKQWINITSVPNFAGTNWWVGHIQGSAKISRYAWLTIKTVDGTLAPLNQTVVTINVMDQSLNYNPVPTPAADQMYGALALANPATSGKAGTILYRAPVEDVSPTFHYKNNSYQLDAYKVVSGQTYYFDNHPRNFSLDGNSTQSLIFSALTPDFRVVSIVFAGGNGNDNSQPAGITINIIATVANNGSVAPTNVNIKFFNTNVDPDGDGIMDAPSAAFNAFLIGQTNQTIPAKGSLTLPAVPYTVTTTQIGGSVFIAVVVNPDRVIPELRYDNNLQQRTIQPFASPDFTPTAIDIGLDRTPVAGGTVFVNVTVRNVGLATGLNFVVTLYQDGVPRANGTVSLSPGGAQKVLLMWTPSRSGTNIDLKAQTFSPGGAPINNRDFNPANDVFDKPNVFVATMPDLWLSASDYSALTYVRGRSYNLNVTIHVTGSDTTGVSVGVYLNVVTAANQTGRLDGIVAKGGTTTLVQVPVGPFTQTGSYTLIVFVNPDHSIPETNYNNNQVSVPVQVIAPSGLVQLASPADGTQFAAGQVISVSGSVVTLSGAPLAGLDVTVTLKDPSGSIVVSRVVKSDSQGQFIVTVPLPSNANQGTWTLRVTTAVSGVQDATRSVVVGQQLQWWQQPVPYLNLPFWIFLVVIGIIAGAIGGATTYLKYIGVGHMVECGECGAYIPESSSACPKCGTEFERGMAKCSNCHAWIPANVKNCPECGTEFATGEVRMTESQERMGTKSCPRCGEPNPIAATVCHKCGAPFQEGPPSMPRGPPPGMPPAQPPPRPPPPPPQGGEQGRGGILGRLSPGGLIQKRVVKKSGEAQQEKKDDVL